MSENNPKYAPRPARIEWAKEIITIYNFVGWRHIARKFDIQKETAMADISELVRSSPDHAFDGPMGCVVAKRGAPK
jgi:hypothetical protein